MSANYFLSALLLLFVGLKLGKVIDWSWLWVLSPFWIPAAIMAVLGLVWIFLRAVETEDDRKRRVLRERLRNYARSLGAHK